MPHASPARHDRVSLWQTAQQYLDTALTCVDGMKVLLIDADVRVALNLVSTQTGLLRREVVFTDALEKQDRPALSYLPCVVLARPTPEAIKAISVELEAGNFREFHLFFTNIVDTDLLQTLTNADTRSLVKTLHEVYLDYLPVTDDTALIRLGSGTDAASAKMPLAMGDWTSSDFSRVCQGLVAAMLATKRRPTIRYRNNSKVTARIAAEVGAKMRMVNTTFFDLRAKNSLLLILDRCDDPVTPLLTQWTYEAMMHEHFGICDGIVDLRGQKALKEDLKARATDPSARDADADSLHVLSADHDSFFASHRDSDWGELCTSVRDLIEAYKALHHIDLATASLSDIKDFMSRFPETKTQSTIMTRHAAIVGRLGDIVIGRSLVDVATIEQEVSCGPAAPNDHGKLVLDAIAKKPDAGEEPAAAPMSPLDERSGSASPPPAGGQRREFAFDLFDVLKLVVLYALRYEGIERAEVHLQSMRDALTTARGASPRYMALIDRYVRFGGAAQRLGTLYPKAPGMLKNMVKAISGFGGEVQNVLTQHTPLLRRFISQAQNGTLPAEHFPVQSASQSNADETTRFSDIIVFIAGGATYEEAHLVSRINRGKVENDPATFPPGAEVVGAPAPGAVPKDGKQPAGAAGEKGMFSAGKALAARLTHHGDEAAAPAPDAVAPVTKDLTCTVRLLANGMIRAADFMQDV